MIPMSAAEIASAVSGQLVAGNPEVVATSVAIDSREVTPGALFVALPGEKVDGHRFAAQAVEAGSSVVIVSDRVFAASLRDTVPLEHAAIILVENGMRAVQALAVQQRDRLRATVIGITGSTGKTSARSFVASVLATTHSVVATEGNQNNELGCPLTILRADESTDVLVVEMGMRAPGEIAELAAIARPHIGIVTNVGPVHLETLGTVQAVAAAKGELLQALPASGCAIVVDDSPYSTLLCELSSAPVTTVGQDCGGECGSAPETHTLGALTPHICARDVSVDAHGCVHATACSRPEMFEPFEVSIPVPGRHHLTNALIAIAVGAYLGVPESTVARNIASTTIPGMRFARVDDVLPGITFINDAYNANPTSVEGSIRTFMTVEPSRRHIAVLGDMLELGEEAAGAHRSIGAVCAEVGLDVLFGYGRLIAYTVEEARHSGVADAWSFTPGDTEIMVRSLREMLVPGDIVLLKGSRGMALERVLEMLASEPVSGAMGAADVR